MKANEKKVTDSKINFITLTIPPQENRLLTEKEVKSILNTWLTYHRKYSNLNNCVWKIKQNKDNQLYIHILTETYIYCKSIKDSWNLILQRKNYLKYHFEKYGSYSPNSVDIKSIKNVKKLTDYIVKEMAKSSNYCKKH